MADTIFAFATPPGRSGVAVLRISGPAAEAAAAALGAGGGAPRTAQLRRVRDLRNGRTLDQALVLRFPAPASFTGEDLVELHLHGSPAVRRGVLAVLERMDGLRPAEAGEFTRRALMNGKLDLAQAEGLADLLAAETAEQARRALAVAEGALSSRVSAWRAELIRALALVEAGIDFAEEDLPEDLLAEAVAVLARLERSLSDELAGSRAAERLREGFEVALVGAPNVGKSTLLNWLAGREAALTSAIAGTTRDVIEVRMDLEGLPVTFVDMAGLRDSTDAIEAMGVARARGRAALADLRVFLVEGDAEALRLRVEPGDLVLRPKADLAPGPGGVSGLTGDGVPAMLARIAAELGARAASPALVSHERQRAAVERGRAALTASRTRLVDGEIDLAAAELQAAVRALDMLVGKVDVEAVLDVVFASFCIGK